MQGYKSICYDIKKFNFEQIIENLYQIKDLSELHSLSTEKYVDLFEVGKDSSTVFHKCFYDKFREGWKEMHDIYQLFIKEVVAQYVEEDFLYQYFPTFRVHLPGNIAVGKFHKDSEFGHPKGEVNFVLPLTDSDDTASIWVETEEDKSDYQAMEMRVGELITFNGNILCHGNKVNRTNRTRVSMDFRILPLSKYNEHETSESVTRKTKFTEGEYYRRFIKA